MQLLNGWGEFVAAFAVFLLSHSLPVRPANKARLVQSLGPAGFAATYSVLSLAVLAWVIGAAGRAPVVILWDWAPWQNHVTYAAMALASGIAALAIGRPNPLSFGGANNDRFDPSQPGIVGWTRHPLLVALFLWSLGHVLPNGTLAHLMLFGTFAGFSLLGMRLIDRRKQREMGAAEWTGLSDLPRSVTFNRGGPIRLSIGGAVFVGLLLAHGPVIGVSPAF